MTTEVSPPTAGRALAILGSSSLITVIAGIASAKVAALLIGPSGVGLVGLVQGISAIVAALIELGLASAIVRAFATTARHQGWSLASLGTTARRAVLLAGVVVIALAGALAPILTAPILGDDRQSLDLLLAAAAGVPVALTAIENGLLIAAHRVRAVARAAVCVAFVSPLVNLAWFATLKEDGVAPGAVCSAIAVFGLTSLIRRRELGEPALDSDSEPAAPTSRRMRAALLRDGVPVMASAMVGAAAVLLLPVIVAGRLGREGVGFYRAANVISLGYTAAVITVIGSDFLPRVSRVSHSAEELRTLVFKQINLLVMVLVPLLALTSAFLPFAVTVLYRDDFAPTVTILEWQLVGDLFRVIGSVLATAVFARFGGTARLVSESVGLALLVGLSTFGLIVDDIRGLGWGFLVTYMIYVVLLWLLLGLNRGGAEARSCVGVMLAGAFAASLPPLCVHVLGNDSFRRIGIVVAVAWVAPLAVRYRRRRAAPALDEL